MNYRISALFSEVGVSFKFSYQLMILLRQRLIESIPASEQFLKKYGQFDLSFILTSKVKCQVLVIDGPIVSKRYKVVEYMLCIPYKVIQNDPLVHIKLLDYLESGMKTVLEKEGFDTKFIPEIIMELKKEVIDNPKY